MSAKFLDTDPTGFPLVWVEPLNMHLQFLPVTKIQFERFLCERASTRFDQAWYEDLLGRNERVTPRRIESNNYWKAFLTGIKPDEVKVFADWCSDAGESTEDETVYQVPTPDQWLAAYSHLKEQDPLPLARFDGLPLTPRARIVLKSLTTAAAPKNLAEQMLMIKGVWELVEEQTATGSRWCSYGEPNKAQGGYMFSLAKGRPNPLQHAETARIDTLGFRLLRRTA